MDERVRSVDDVQFDFKASNGFAPIDPKSTLLIKSTDFTLNEENKEPEELNEEDEWNQVPKFEVKFSTQDEQHQEVSPSLTADPIQSDAFKRSTLNEQKSHVNFDFINQNLNKLLNPNDVQAETNKHHYHSDHRHANFTQRILRKLFGPPKLHKTLNDSFHMINALASKQFDESNQLHRQMLFTIYRRLTDTEADCARFGPHWENIGYQGIHFSPSFTLIDI